MLRRVGQLGVVLGLALIAGLLPVVGAVAASASLEVTAWQVDQATGTIVYDVNVHGTCETTCSWSLSGWYSDGTVDQYQRGIASGSVYTSGAFTKRTTGTLSSADAREITHLKTKVTSSTNVVTWSGAVRVAEPYAAPTVTLKVDKWQADRGSGLVDYDVTLNATGLGQRNGPCDQVRCAWGIEAYYKGGSTQRLYHVLYSSSNSGGTMWTTTQQVTKLAFPANEVTHLRGYVKPHSCSTPCPNETLETWSVVSPPYPAPAVTLKVDKWQVDTAWGRVDYDLTIKGTGLGQINGPCDAIRCQWGIEAWHKDAAGQRRQYTVYSNSNSGGTTWTVSHRALSSAYSTAPVTHLRAYVRPYDCLAPCANESVDSGLIPVGAAAPPGSLSLVVNAWTADVESGAATYDLEVSYSEDSAAPACASGCSVAVDAFYKSGGVETFQGTLGSWSLSGPLHIWGTRAVGGASGEITHLRASVTPANSPTSRLTHWKEISAPYPTGSIDLAVDVWEGDPDSGTVAFELSLSARGASQVRGPCQENACEWKVAAHHEEGTTTTLASRPACGGNVVGRACHLWNDDRGDHSPSRDAGFDVRQQ